MVFSSLTFLLIFLPVTAFLYYFPNLFVKGKSESGKHKLLTYKNVVLCIASLIFYAWGEPLNIVLMILSILFNFFIGLDIEKHINNGAHKKFLLISAVIFDVGMLAVFKYTGFAVDNIKNVFGFSFNFSAPALPIGISFYTFQILSYVIDVYRKKTAAQKSIVDFSLYISMFPQLIAGPIVQYGTIEKQLKDRTEELDLIGNGIFLFVVGLAKKVILANSAGAIYEEFLSGGVSELSMLSAWIAVIFYSFQIYFDFSGYSDMAIGLGAIFGFRFPENFNYPYFADSITDFWRRWHITLSLWFRDYVYIPLGGNRCSKIRNIFNLFVVWALTGLWHGASWNFVLWGIYYFVLLCLEKYVFDGLIKKLPKLIRHIVTFIFVLFGWVLFANTDITDAFSFFSALFGTNGIWDTNAIYLLTSNFILFVIMCIASVPLFKLRDTEKKYIKLSASIVFMIICMICLVGDTYNPFLYFRF